jgi:Smg protein
MFDVLVYLYETYWRPEACPSSELLTRKLSAVGFEDEDIAEALSWLSATNAAQDSSLESQSSTSFRVYTPAEQARLGTDCLSFLAFLESSGVLSPKIREAVLDRCMSLPSASLRLEDFKVLVLMVFWSLGEEPDELVLDELFLDDEDRLLH